jgi:hypothetical protein
VSAGDQPALPHTWRPHGVRVAATVLGAMLVALVAVVWFAWGEHTRSAFTLGQRATLLGLGLLGLVAWHALVRTRVSADGRGLTVVNGYRRREYEWSQVVGVNLRRGAPWAGLDLSDGTSVSMVGIQGSDGQRAVRAVRELRALVAANTRTEKDDPPA